MQKKWFADKTFPIYYLQYYTILYEALSVQDWCPGSRVLYNTAYRAYGVVCFYLELDTPYIDKFMMSGN